MLSWELLYFSMGRLQSPRIQRRNHVSSGHTGGSDCGPGAIKNNDFERQLLWNQKQLPNKHQLKDLKDL